MGSKFTGTDRIGPNYRIGPDCAGPVQNCNYSWLVGCFEFNRPLRHIFESIATDSREREKEKK